MQSIHLTRAAPDGTQVWAKVVNGAITNGGVNLVPQQWLAKPADFQFLLRAA
jgi:hypothetical protein